ncbi:hypothetical protein HYW21_01925 [Candidatus Woesearchaeota archaeon]|nr:hypothetical protein [Candidatus Woesearchaeota archaeon]
MRNLFREMYGNDHNPKDGWDFSDFYPHEGGSQLTPDQLLAASWNRMTEGLLIDLVAEASGRKVRRVTYPNLIYDPANRRIVLGDRNIDPVADLLTNTGKMQVIEKLRPGSWLERRIDTLYHDLSLYYQPRGVTVNGLEVSEVEPCRLLWSNGSRSYSEQIGSSYYLEVDLSPKERFPRGCLLLTSGDRIVYQVTAYYKNDRKVVMAGVLSGRQNSIEHEILHSLTN